MSAQDMRDMLGLTGDVARPPPLKKQKTLEKRPLEKGIAREVSALMGERAPPIAMIQVQPKYKQRPRRSHRVAPWDENTLPNLVHKQNNSRRQSRRQMSRNSQSQNHKRRTTSMPSTMSRSRRLPTTRLYTMLNYRIRIGQRKRRITW
ncbi:hypothetical protein KCU92_g352, partial [Aureobasidium melanogenum]